MFSVNNVMCQESAPALKDNTFVMAFIRPETQYTGKWQRLIYAEVFKRLGIKAEFRDYPVKRASIEADAGNVDGEAGRIYPYAVEHPNLIRVEESLFFMIFSAFGIKPSISQLSGWDSLKGKNYKVEYRRGTQLCEINLFKVMNRENISEVTDTEQGIKKLISGRTDLFVEDEVSVLSLMQMTEFKGSKIRTVGIMESFPLYLYLHKKHAALVPKMAEIIKAIKAEGLIEQYRMMVEKEFDIVRK
jgi:ABC-type amino acid transport substrate-binding protein